MKVVEVSAKGVLATTVGAEPWPSSERHGPIVVVELSNRSGRHAPFNAAFLQTVMRAFPERGIAFWADPTHLDAIRPLLDGEDGLAFHALTLWPDKAEVTHSSFARILHAIATLRQIHRAHAGKTAAMIVSSSTPAGMFGAWIMQRMGGPPMQFPLHGEVNVLREGWRSRNPLARIIDLHAALRWLPGQRFRILVLERHVAEAMVQLAPWLEGKVDFIPHPAGASLELEALPDVPVRIGTLGIANRGRGFDLWMRTVAALADVPGLAFHHVGAMHREFIGQPMTGFTDPPDGAHLKREVYLARLKALHYVCVPVQGSYYDLAASGTLLDAVAAGKPVIALRRRSMESFFQQAGDIGFLCEDEAELRQVLHNLANSFDPARHARQAANMRRLRESRTPQALADPYARILSQAMLAR
ncbi:hypothetical protein [Falsiroseomonas sp.]|uniref:glycosyltransferase n=1 Tax=Falsiroseomonas sp. TaxID=2870721 RepID=UPI0027334407|nr:hypothetical protein [Falsiroseomonas sp.]MDP3417313.1 hypothetical protein [Falsiroseomonas sp.]